MMEVVNTVTQAQLEDSGQRITCRDLSDKTISEASEALLRLSSRIKILDHSYLSSDPGIYILPRWQQYRILRIGQRRGLADAQIRGQSAHGVSFGVAQIMTPNGETPIIKVAIKPYRPKTSKDQEAPRKAIYEATVNSIVLERKIDTTDPICVITDVTAAHIITPVKEGVQTLDNEPWHQFFGATPKIRHHFISRLNMIGEVLAILHLNGIQQGDTQLRNYWKCPGDGLEAFDWESSTVRPLPLSGEDLEKSARNDLDRLFNNLCSDPSRPILTGHPAQRREQFKDWIHIPYYNKLETSLLMSDAGNDLLDAASVIQKLF